MYALRKWMYKPKKTDSSVLAQFFHADEALNQVAAELDSFDGRKDPERCTALVNKLRHCQDKVLVVIEKIIQEVVPERRATRDFRVKFPEDVLQENLAGQLWFGAECLSAGSSIMNREVESASLRPLAKALTQQLDCLRGLLRDQCLRPQSEFTEQINEALLVFDKLFAEFELGYVSAMVPVKTMKEYDMLQGVTVLFCETVQRALHLGLLSQDLIDAYDPALMFTIPRLAIICGLLIYPEGPINPDMDPMNMSEMFRPFQMLLYKIRELLWTLSRNELWLLEKALSSSDDSLPLSDKSFEEQLNKLNLIEQKHHSGTSSSAKSDSVPSLETETEERENQDQGVMSHSPSTLTVVAISSHSAEGAVGTKTSDSGDVKQDHLLQIKTDKVPHQDSCDSGMLSMSDQAGSEAASKLVPVDEARGSTRTLLKSRSWPEKSSRKSNARQTDVERSVSVESSQDFLSSLELLQSQGDDLQRVTCTQSLGSQEFSFQLPHNTSVNAGEDKSGTGEDFGASAVANRDPNNDQKSTVQETEPKDNTHHQVMYTQNGCDENENEKTPDTDREDRATGNSVGENLAPQIGFITGALNNIFVTDPGFQGVAPPVIYDPPLTSVAENSETKRKSSKRASRNKKCSSKLSKNPTSNSCDTNASGSCRSDQGQTGSHQSRQHSNCDNPPTKSKPHKKDCSNTDQIRGADSKVKTLKYIDVVRSGTGPLSSSPGSMEFEWDRESYSSSDSSSYTSADSYDDEEIALAIQAAEVVARQEARARFKTSSELIHKLFVCVSGVADQLQTNYASDFRHILKCVFECNASGPDEEPELDSRKDKMDGSRVALEGQTTRNSADSSSVDTDSNHSNQDTGPPDNNIEVISPEASPSHHPPVETAEAAEPPPDWIPDEESPTCSSCEAPFSFVRRRHHCRNCGKIFCRRCSSNSVPLPHYGHCKPVRVCNHCFMFQVTPFTVSE